MLISKFFSYPGPLDTNLRFIPLLLGGFLLSLSFTSSPVWAGEVLEVIGLDFGSVAFIPRECEVVINAKNGETTPEATNAVVSDGKSGKITIQSDVIEQVLVEYPDSVSLHSSDETIVISGVQSYSQYHSQFVDLEANVPHDIHIGGKLTLDGNEGAGNYSGTLQVELTFTVSDE